MTDNSTRARTLFATVGLGNPGRLEETLYAPISKSINEGDWSCVVLLPSRGSLEHARELKRRHARYDVHIRPLPDDASENDVDSCYGHFQRVVEEFYAQRPDDMAVDITRGTKAMSAALMLAAFRYRIPVARYVEGDRDPQAPAAIIPGSERIRDVRLSEAIGHRALDDARLLFQHGDFAAASHLLRALAGGMSVEVVRLADFYSAWDRLDYKAADEVSLVMWASQAWACFVPTPEVRAWVHELAQPWPQRQEPTYFTTMAARVRRLMVDVYANGRRRVRRAQFEDALLRAYRVLEMLGQARLLDRELDSAALPSDHPVVTEFQQHLGEKGGRAFGVNKDGTLSAGRELVARLLKRFGDPLAEDLLRVGGQGALGVASRNRSVLIHGFEAVGPADRTVLERWYDELEQLLRKDRHDVDQDLQVATFPDRSEAVGL